AFQVLDDYLTLHEDEVVEIEMLPPALQPMDGSFILHEGLNVGIPKETLVLAYLAARSYFNAGSKDVLSPVTHRASRIVLLFDPEHVTAAGFRKRRLLELKGEEHFSKTLTQELALLNSILTSPLHRQSKSPTLWFHRLWLMHLLLPYQLSENGSHQFLSFVRAEQDAVFKAGERHPKNYYAWQYQRRLFNIINKYYGDGSNYLWKSTYPEFLVTSTLMVKSWCLRHPSDISGWSCLLSMVARLEPTAKRPQIIKEVIDWTIKLQSEQESIWIFLR
ncbi:hypothetical protein EJ04DRAFT_416587, partial [Polyplosphaeria fusca]